MITEETLDPENWEETRALGHRMLDDMMDYLQAIRERPAWKPIPDSVISQLRESFPENPEGAEKAYQDFLNLVLPYSTGSTHPRFWGWVKGTGTATGMLSEMLAGALNLNTSSFNIASSYVESQVLQWCKELIGYPVEASGILVSGGSMANLVGLTVARNAKAGREVMRMGIQSQGPGLTLYGSTEMHSSIDKAVELLGLGDDALRKIRVGPDFQIDVEELQKRIAEDKALGFKPICVIGNTGTVNTGACDDLVSLASICKDEDLWLHVDGAFGAWASLSPQLKPLVQGMELADSIAFDMHKWMYVQYEIGCTLVRHPEQHHKTFAVGGTYLNGAQRGYSAGPVRWNEYGIQLSRGFRALKVWMSIKEHGVGKYRRLIQQNVEQARYLAHRITESPHLALLAPVPLNVVCFRFVDPQKSDAELNFLNEEILMQIQEAGIAIPSSTVINGHYAIRVAITNHRSRREDFDLLVKEVVGRGKVLASPRT